MRWGRHVPAFGVAGSVLFATMGLAFSVAILVVTAGVVLADDIGIYLHDVAVDSAAAGQAAYNAQEQGTDQGYSSSGYTHSTVYVQNVVDGVVQVDTGNLSVLQLSTPQVTIDTSGIVRVTLSGSFEDTVLTKAFSAFVPSNPTATFPVSVTASGAQS